jgi:DHA1 family tetracycline resistance protein-like MFS transporter
MMIGLVCGVVGFALYGLAPNGTLFMLALPLVALWGLANPAIQSLATRRVSALEQGQLQGAQASLAGIADMLGPLLFTSAFAAVVGKGSPVYLPGIPYFIAAALVAGALAVCWRVTQPVAVPAAAE